MPDGLSAAAAATWGAAKLVTVTLLRAPCAAVVKMSTPGVVRPTNLPDSLCG